MRAQGRRREGAVVARMRAIGCLPLLAAGLVTMLVLVVAVRMLEPAPTLWRKSPVAGALPTSPQAITPEPPRPSVTAGPKPSSSPSPSKQKSIRYEAEDAFLWLAKMESNHDGYSGSGFVNYDNRPGGLVQWTFEVAVAGRATLRLGYANGTESDRPMDVNVNGEVKPVAFPGTGSWSTWKSRSIEVDLRAGPNLVRVIATGPEGGPNLDYLDVRT